MNISLPSAVALAMASLLASGCASTHPQAPLRTQEAHPIAAPTDSLDLATAAARAIAVSPKVRAAAFRHEAACARSNAVALPPDPGVALMFGIPIDQLGGTGFTATIMSGLGWLLAHDSIIAASERERDSAARELIASCSEVAAEARRLTRALHADQRASVAAKDSLAAQEEMSLIEQLRFDGGEGSREALLERQSAALAARSTLAETESQTHETVIALQSLLALTAIPTQLVVNDASSDTPSNETLEVFRARAALAKARAVFAETGSILGTNAEVGGGYMRDLEDREAVQVALNFTLPIFRRSHEIDAARADVEAASADLEEAMRVASVENDHAIERCAQARNAAQSARERERLAEAVLAISAHALLEGETTRMEVATTRMRWADARMSAATRDLALADAIANVEKRAAEIPNTMIAGGTK